MPKIDEIRRRLEAAITIAALPEQDKAITVLLTNAIPDITFLLSEVERLQEEDRQWDKHSLVQIVEERDRLREENAQLQDHYDDVMARLDKINNDDDTLPYRIDTVIAEVESLRAELARLQALAPRCGECRAVAVWVWWDTDVEEFVCDEHKYEHVHLEGPARVREYWRELPEPPGEETGG